MFKVKIVGGVGKEVIIKEHTIPAGSEEEARTWGHKQAAALRITGEPLIISVTAVA